MQNRIKALLAFYFQIFLSPRLEMNLYLTVAVYLVCHTVYVEAYVCSDVCDCIGMLERDPSQHVSLQNDRRNGDLQETNRVLRLAYADTRFFNHDPHDSDDRYWFVAFWNLHPALRKHRCTTNYQAENYVELFSKFVEKWFREGQPSPVSSSTFPGATSDMDGLFNYYRGSANSKIKLQQEAHNVCDKKPNDEFCIVNAIIPASRRWRMVTILPRQDSRDEYTVNVREHFQELTAALVASSLFLKWHNPTKFNRLEPIGAGDQKNASDALIGIIFDTLESEDIDLAIVLADFVPKYTEIPNCLSSTAVQCIFPKVMTLTLEKVMDLIDDQSSLSNRIGFRVGKEAIMLNLAFLALYDPTTGAAVETNSRSKYRNIFTSTMDNIIAAINRNDFITIKTLMDYLPKTKNVLGCIQSQAGKAQCIYEKIHQQLKLFINSHVDSTERPKRIILETNIDFKELLKFRQIEEILKTVQQQGFSISEVARVVQNRFGELRNYFYQVQDFNKKKANADISYINAMIFTYKNQLRNISYDVGNKTASILVSAMVSASADLVEKTAQAVIAFAQMLNPLRQIFGGSPTEFIDRMADVSNTIANVISSERLNNYFTTLQRRTKRLRVKLDKNSKFLETVRKLVSSVNENDDNFGSVKKEFLDKYADYTPEVRKPEITEVGEFWNQIIEEACTIIKDPGTPGIAAGAVESKVNYEGYCWKAKAKVQGMIETLEQIYDFQFDLIETLASCMRAKTAIEAATEISADYDNSDMVSNDFLPFNFRNYATLTYVTYKIQQWQAVKDYCDILEYKNGGLRPEECKRKVTDISILLSRPEPQCTTESLMFVDIPVKTSSDYEASDTSSSSSSSSPSSSSEAEAAEEGEEEEEAEGKAEGEAASSPFSEDVLAKIDLDDLFAGRPTSFRVPNKEWLIKQQWVSKDILFTKESFYIKSFSLFVPAQSEKERSITVTATASIDNKLLPDGPKYIIAPAPTFINEYKVGKGFKPCLQRKIDNPYSICSTKKLPQICPMTTQDSHHRPSALYPSIYTKWILTLKGYNDTNFPHPTTPVTVKAGIRICNVRRFQGNSERRNQIPEAEWGCCSGVNKYWSAKDTMCKTCPVNSSVLLNGYYCERDKQENESRRVQKGRRKKRKGKRKKGKRKRKNREKATETEQGK